MDVDWEVEIGGDAPVIEAQWPGLVDLRLLPQRVDEIFEVTLMPPLKDLLLALNSAESPVWTSKCDVWEPDLGAIAFYIDILPREPQFFTDWNELKRFCQELVRRIAMPSQNSDASRAFLNANESADDTSLNLVLRRALNDGNEGFGVTAYFAAADAHTCSAKSALVVLIGKFLDALMETRFPRTRNQSKIRNTGE